MLGYPLFSTVGRFRTDPRIVSSRRWMCVVFSLVWRTRVMDPSETTLWGVRVVLALDWKFLVLLVFLSVLYSNTIPCGP